MGVIYWSIIFLSFIIAFVALVFPIVPGVLFLGLGFLLYGLFFTFDPLTPMFWIIQVFLVVLLFIADYVSNLVGVKKRGGTKAAVWGSTIGLLTGPFIIPFAGILIGPFLGAVIAELLVHKKPINEALKVGVGSLFGFLGGAFIKGLLQFVMIGYFLFAVL
ncbi:DUF456 domain-containing protein [Pseudalkalibacillus caeni]|uniref:DUF456 domain-containing protein n=1 Tax=Exobacillus caeni TaxID=2574798 RepID=A0A5R9F3V9_9BACL|nr:DUF456 domain-containing protein [Pseudalkalibacillus caeni]TLS36298.1 DUF456 domain-containing protein [Pseudalkalibacillus caeni]